MKQVKVIYLLLATLLLVVAASAQYDAGRGQSPAPAVAPSLQSAPAQKAGAGKTAGIELVDPQEVPGKVTNFLGSLTPGGTAEAAGRERTYIVSYQVDFLRKTPKGKTPEESLSYSELQQQDEEKMPPYVYFGEMVTGKFDPAQPEVITVRATINGKEASGYVDSAKLWLEPVLQRPESDRYMAVTETTLVRVLPDPSSPPVLEIIQGEVMDAVGQVKLKGETWIKLRFNSPELPRYGFISRADLQPLVAASINQSSVVLVEIPHTIRASTVKFSESERRRLSQSGFYTQPIPPEKQVSVDDMADAYRENRSWGEQFFVTSDLYLHADHLMYDRMMQDIEEKKLFPAARDMSRSLAKTSEDEFKLVPPQHPIREAMLGDLLYFSVAAKLFDSSFTVAQAVRPQTDEVVSRIEAGEGELPSQVNFLGPTKEDFTQYKVRGHYERSEALKRYFRGMMWFGRHNFLLSDNNQTLSAILLPHLVEAAHETSRFEALDTVVTFLIGRQDKYTLAEYRSVNQKVFGTTTPGFGQLGTNLDSKLAAFQQTAWTTLPKPQIVSVQTGKGASPDDRFRAVAGLKFLGQRYVLDAFLLNQLTSPNVGSDAHPRNLPSALDVMMTLGCETASHLQQQAQKENQWPNYESQAAKLKGSTEEQLARRSTFYEQWLYALRTLFLPTSSRQMFAVREPWRYKNLNTGLASWTELKHDTVLYAEQSAAEMGGGSEFEIPPYVPPGPKGYVEPNPDFFKQLVASIDQMLSSLRSTNFITDQYVDKFTRFRELAAKAQTIAQKEISGEPISSDDYQWIQEMRWSFDLTLLMGQDVFEVPDPSQLRMGLVADIATDGFSGRVLEEGIGTPQRIVVLVKDAFGGTRLTVGYVYSWYEFASTRRWSDSEWQRLIYESDAQTRKQQGVVAPQWYSMLQGTAGAP